MVDQWSIRQRERGSGNGGFRLSPKPLLRVYVLEMSVCVHVGGALWGCGSRSVADRENERCLVSALERLITYLYNKFTYCSCIVPKYGHPRKRPAEHSVYTPRGRESQSARERAASRAPASAVWVRQWRLACGYKVVGWGSCTPREPRGAVDCCESCRKVCHHPQSFLAIKHQFPVS